MSALRPLLAAVTVGVLALGGGEGALAAVPGEIAELGLGASARVYVFGLATGADGNIWFADLGCSGLGRCALGRIAPTGALRLFTHGLNAGSVPFEVVLGRDGDIWFTDEGTRPAIGRVTPGGQIREFSGGLRRGSQPFALAVGPANTVWFTDQGRHPAIGRITERGQITEFSRGLGRGSVPFGITTVSGRLAFTDRGCSGSGRCAIGSVTATGEIRERTTGLRRGSDPLGMAPGLHGRIWFADGSGAIGQISAAGRITERALPHGSSPVAVATGPDGAVWFADEGTQPAIGRIGAGGAVREFRRGLPAGSEPAQIVAAPDGDMWFTDEGATAGIGRVTTGVPPALLGGPAATGAPRVGAPLRCRPPRWEAWAGLVPSSALLPFDGYRWLRDGLAIPGATSSVYAVRAADRGRRIACRVTATYPPPYQTTAVASSPGVIAAG